MKSASSRPISLEEITLNKYIRKLPHDYFRELLAFNQHIQHATIQRPQIYSIYAAKPIKNVILKLKKLFPKL